MTTIRTRQRRRRGGNSRSLLVPLILSDQILHVRLRFRELHRVHTFLGVPVQERLPLKHGSELVVDTLGEFLNSGRASEEGNGHFHSEGGSVALSGEGVVGDPLDEVGMVQLHLNVSHPPLDILHGKLATGDGGSLQAR